MDRSSNATGPVTFLVKGASGGSGTYPGGFGGYAQATLSGASSTPGTTFYFNVGQSGDNGGYGGGGDSGGGSGDGGGMSWVSYDSYFSTSTALLVAAGGGGGQH